MEKVFVGRQAIFDRHLNVAAYELLYRGADMKSGGFDGNAATAQVILNSLMEIGLETLVGEHEAFINMTRAYLTGSQPIPFSPGRIVLEILEDIEVDDELIAAVKHLRLHGFRLALDDFTFLPQHLPLLQHVHIIKIDLMGIDQTRLPAQVQALKKHPLKLLAEKIETQDEFVLCKELGFDYFQGYFLCRPNIVDAQRIPGNRLATLQLLTELNNPESQVDKLEALISQNVTLSYKLLRYVNSAFMGMPRNITSLRQAIVLLGTLTIRNLASLMVMSENDKPSELIKIAMVRAKMCEALGRASGALPDIFFTVGLFSLLDAMLDTPMENVLSTLPLHPDIHLALTRHEGLAGRALAATLAHERGDWDQLSMDYPPEVMTRSYLDALTWTENALGTIASGTT